MLKPTITFILLLSAMFFTSCDSNFFHVQIQNNSSDTLHVNYILLEHDDSLRFDGGPGVGPTGHGRFEEKYDSITKVHSFVIAPGRLCYLVNTMNEDLDRISDFVLFKRLEIIKGSDTVILAKNRGTSAIFTKIVESHKVNWTLVVD
ncbi:hypothetical protein Fluta_3473 [Fluviicola taffensis DSM 16823]|uniref:Lipoprotein n=2 Tax=Fluviicola TaxID=332102 RepID=F2ICH5_FLUTR|nr:hypothetical protein Fluta_3473 [Fluviicola taffensis DSM 16823]